MARRRRRTVARRKTSPLQMTVSPAKVSFRGGRLGDMAFGLGVVIALVLGFGSTINAYWARSQWFGFVLLLLGLVVGFKNIKAVEVGPFLLGSVALILATAVANLLVINALIPKLGTFVQASLNGFIMMIAPAAVVVSFKAVYSLAK